MRVTQLTSRLQGAKGEGVLWTLNSILDFEFDPQTSRTVSRRPVCRSETDRQCRSDSGDISTVDGVDRPVAVYHEAGGVREAGSNSTCTVLCWGLTSLRRHVCQSDAPNG